AGRTGWARALLAKASRPMTSPSSTCPRGGPRSTATPDLDRTMVAMAENALQYAASARAAGVKLGILRYVASDGNG
ncbi:MAG: hypothetical protein ABSB49_21365, partial [Polyangia bacterium]